MLIYYFKICRGPDRTSKRAASDPWAVVCPSLVYTLHTYVQVYTVSDNILFRIKNKLISGFHRAFLKSITFIGRLMHSIV